MRERPTSTSTSTAADLSTWDRGAWFGALSGGTLWLLIGGGLALARGQLVAGGVALACCAAGFAAGVHLWTRRARLDAYRALQILIWLLFVLAVVAIVTFDVTGAVAGFDGVARTSRVEMYACLAVFPALSVVFHLRRAKSRRG